MSDLPTPHFHDEQPLQFGQKLPWPRGVYLRAATEWRGSPMLRAVEQRCAGPGLAVGNRRTDNNP